MPGFTSECQSGAHEQCASRECRCQCHPWTQQLLLLRQPVHTNIPAPTVELQKNCPQCGGQAQATDNYCRKDGQRLILGKCCFGCGAPQQSGDEYCWQCGLKCGEKPAPAPQESAPAAPAYEQQVLERLRRLAKEKGLLKETTV